MRTERVRTARHWAWDARLAAGTCTLIACGCLPVLKWWATGGWRRPIVAATALVAAVLASALYHFIARGEFVRCLALSTAAALAGMAVWGLCRLL